MGSKTSLHDAHQGMGAKIVDFGGWDMPLHYGSQIEEHHLVRKTSGMFDVSHMTVVEVQGERAKAYLQYLLTQELADEISILTPMAEHQRGCQLSLSVNVDNLDGKAIHHHLESNGVITDWREPNVIRVAPVPLYNSFEDAFHFVRILKECLNEY